MGSLKPAERMANDKGSFDIVWTCADAPDEHRFRQTMGEAEMYKVGDDKPLDIDAVRLLTRGFCPLGRRSWTRLER